MKHGFACIIAAAVFACGPVDTGNGGSGATGTGGGPDGGAPSGGGAPGSSGTASIGIVSPADGATLTFGDDHGGDQVAVVVDLRGMHVAADCGSDSSCGVLGAFIDDDRCGNPNASASSGNRVTADFGKCGTVAGGHRLRAEIWRGSTLVARSNEIHVTVVQQDDHHDDGDHHGDDGDDHDHGDDHGRDDLSSGSAGFRRQ